MAYNPTNWVNGQSYGADAFNNIEGGIVELEGKINSGAGGYNKKQHVNMAKAVQKLRNNELTEFCFRGDSVFYGFDMMNEDGDAVQENCIPDHGSPLTGFTRSPVTIYDTFKEVMIKVYEGNTKIKKQIYSGDTVYTSFYRWNPSASDFVIINYGINDAMGGHINDAYTDGVSTDIPKPYKGNVEYFMQGYRKVIEKEIDGGTAVVLLTPTKQTLLIDGLDTDNRTMIDIYEQAVKALGVEYGCPVIDGNTMTKNFGNDMAIDFCHFTKEGFKAIGYRLASVFIGQSPSNPFYVTSGTYLGVNPQIDNSNISLPAVFDNTEKSPNLPIMLNSADLGENVNRVLHGLQANVTGAGSITWSFYCDRDGLVVVPCLYTKDQMDISVKLDFGASQGKWTNYWNCVSADGTIDRNHVEPTTLFLKSTEMETMGVGKVHGLHKLSATNTKALKITTKGWHTIEIAVKPKDKPVREVNPFSDIPEDFGDGVVEVFGINFISLEDYKRAIQ